jgi:hypothetical protein
MMRLRNTNCKSYLLLLRHDKAVDCCIEDEPLMIWDHPRHAYEAKYFFMILFFELTLLRYRVLPAELLVVQDDGAWSVLYMMEQPPWCMAPLCMVRVYSWVVSWRNSLKQNHQPERERENYPDDRRVYSKLVNPSPSWGQSNGKSEKESGVEIQC